MAKRVTAADKAQRDQHVRAIKAAVEAQLPEDDPDCVHQWVYETAVAVMDDRLKDRERAAWRQGFMEGGRIVMKVLIGKVRSLTGFDIQQEIRGQMIDALLKTKLGK